MQPTRPATSPILATVLALGLLTGCAQAADPPPAAPASSAGFSAGLTVQPMATADDIGLPVYPGAKPTKDKDDDSPGANLALWGGPFGMRLQVLKLQAPDGVDAVARYYRDALSRYGQVLDCSSRSDAPAAEGGDKLTLRCDGDKPRRGERVFKAGTKKQMRIVSVEPSGSGSLVQLVRLEFRSQ